MREVIDAAGSGKIASVTRVEREREGESEIGEGGRLFFSGYDPVAKKITRLMSINVN